MLRRTSHWASVEEKVAPRKEHLYTKDEGPRRKSYQEPALRRGFDFFLPLEVPILKHHIIWQLNTMKNNAKAPAEHPKRCTTSRSPPSFCMSLPSGVGSLNGDSIRAISSVTSINMHSFFQLTQAEVRTKWLARRLIIVVLHDIAGSLPKGLMIQKIWILFRVSWTMMLLIKIRGTRKKMIHLGIHYDKNIYEEIQS